MKWIRVSWSQGGKINGFCQFQSKASAAHPTKLNPSPSLTGSKSVVTIVLRRKLFASLKEHIPHVLVFHYNYAHQKISGDVQDDQKGLRRCYGDLWWFRTREHIHIFQSLVDSFLTVLSHLSLVRKGSACYNLFKWFFSTERFSALTIPLLLGQRWIFRTFLSRLDERELQHGFDVPSVINKLLFLFCNSKSPLAHLITAIAETFF